MKLDGHIKALIAVGASITANCQPCLQSSMALARESGADEREILEAIEVAKHVRKGAASTMDLFTAGLMPAIFSTTPMENGGCDCATPISTMEGRKE